MMWKPLCKRIGQTTAWSVMKRVFFFLVFCGLIQAIAMNVWWVFKHGPSGYIKAVAHEFGKSDEELRRERDLEYKNKKLERRAKIAEEHANAKK